MIIGAAGNVVNVGNANSGTGFGAAPGNSGTVSGIQGRRSLLGLAAMRRSETTEDSAQCMYNDGALIMSSLPMPMHSIKQVIAEEEAAEEQDERTTNKESNKRIAKASGSGGNRPGSAQLTNEEALKGESSRNKSSSNKMDEGRGTIHSNQTSDTPKISSSDNVEILTTKKHSSDSKKNSDFRIETNNDGALGA